MHVQQTLAKMQTNLANLLPHDELIQALSDVKLSDDQDPPERPAKRLKMDANPPGGKQAYADLLAEILSLLELPQISACGEAEDVAQPFTKMTEVDRCRLLCAISRMPCAHANISHMRSEKRFLNLGSVDCRLCDSVEVPRERRKEWLWDQGAHVDDCRHLTQLLTTVVSLPELQRSNKARTLAAVALRRIVNHVSDPQTVDLASSPLGQWCLKSVHSSSRELRIAAAQALSAFLRSDVPAEVLRKNRVLALDFLRTLSSREEIRDQETLIFAWGQIARVCGEEELNIIVLQLVEYLGHPNTLICALAYDELSSLARDLNREPLELLRPFWRTIAIAVVRDLHTRPQKAQQIADLLSMSVNRLLLITQAETVPHLVLTRRKDVLQRVAAARGPNVAISDLWMQPRKHLGATLSLLFQQQVPDLESFVMETLQEVAPAFKDKDLDELVRLEPISTACELLRAAGEQDEKGRTIVSHVASFARSINVYRSSAVSNSLRLLQSGDQLKRGRDRRPQRLWHRSSRHMHWESQQGSPTSLTMPEGSSL